MHCPGARSRNFAGVVAALFLSISGPAASQLPPDYTVRQLSPSGEATSHVTSQWAIDPRGEWIAFAGDVEIAGAEAVYAMRRNGADLHRLSGYGAAGTIDEVEFSADGRRVVYAGDLETNGVRELWSVLLPGSPGTAVKLNVAATGGGVLLYREGAANRIAYIVETASGRELRGVPVAGPAASGLLLNPPLAGDEIVYLFDLTPGGTWILVVLYDPVATTSRIYAVPIAGPAGNEVLLADALAGGCLAFPGPASRDDLRLVYLVSCPGPGGNEIQQAWSVAVAGPAAAAVSLAGSFATGGAIQSIGVSPDSTQVVFLADKLVDETFELWSVPILGPAAGLTRLNPTLVAGGDVARFVISPDSSRVAYIADQQSDTRDNGFAVPIAGPSSAAKPLYLGVLATPGDATDAVFSPDSMKIFFRGDFSVDERFDVYTSPGDGVTTHARITNQGSNPVPARSVATTWQLHPGAERVFYVFDESAPLDRRGLGEQRRPNPYAGDARLNGDPAAGGQVSSFVQYPDGAGLLYSSDETADGKFELFTVDVRIFGDGFELGDSAAWTDLP